MLVTVIILAIAALALCIILVFVSNTAVRYRTQEWDQEKRAKRAEEELAQLRSKTDHIELREANLISIEQELARIATITPDQAKAELVSAIESQCREEFQEQAKAIEVESLENVQVNTRKALLDSMERTAMQYVVENTVAIIELPSEDVKGRIIGREGRNIRSFEQITGVDLIVDETPEAVVISSFDPIRRETARLTLMNLIVDGRIHPARIEEVFAKAKQEVYRVTYEAGEKAAVRANIGTLPKPLIETLGKLRFRSSYAQNVLDHSVEVSKIAANIAQEMGLNVEVVKRAGLLHDIGKALGEEWEGPHALTGMAYLKQFDEKPVLLNAVGAHHREIEPESPEAQVIIIADILSASRPGARRENLENYLKRMTALEAFANAFPGVEKSYAVQAGREIRIIVKPEVIDDAQARKMATEVANKIKAEIEVPGQIKVTVIRESRFSDIAK
jgi:ribonucrease Y